MAHIDYEAAWHDLAAVIVDRPTGWGTRALAAEMIRVAAKHRVSETFLERSLRMYGGTLTLAAPTAEVPSNDAPGNAARIASVPAHRQSHGGHDGHHPHRTFNLDAVV